MYSTPAVAVGLKARVVYCLCKWLHFRILILHWFGILGKLKSVIGQLPLAGVRLSHPSPCSGSEERQLEAIPSLDNVHRKSGCSDVSRLLENAVSLEFLCWDPASTPKPTLSWTPNIFSSGDSDSGSECLVWILISLGSPRNNLHFLMCKMFIIRLSDRIVLRFLWDESKGSGTKKCHKC